MAKMHLSVGEDGWIIGAVIGVLVLAAALLYATHSSGSPADAGKVVGPIASFGASTSAPVSPSASASPEATLRVPQDPRIFFVGDQITLGYGASSLADSFPAKLLDALPGAKLAGYVAQPGARTAQLYTLMRAHKIVSADLVVVEAGTNDVDHRPATSIAAFSKQYRKLLKVTKATVRGARLVCAGPWAPTSTALTYDRAIGRACAAAGGKFASLAALVSTPANLAATTASGVIGSGALSDVHEPNDAGHDAIATTLRRLVRSTG